MKLSIFTPTNNTEWLHRPFESIKNQIDNDCRLNVEWVLVPNNGVQIQNEIKNNSWVKVYDAPQDLKTIGGLKNFACGKCTGDVFIELDHDDELIEGSLITIKNALFGVENAFLYSDNVIIRNDNYPVKFNKNFGWQYYQWNGHDINSTFEIMPRSLSEIFFAPDHVRVWTRKAYESAGGHDKAMMVGDDHDLIIRTYLQGTEFIQIKEPLYKYYVYGTNSWLKNMSLVQKEQANNRDKYLRKLVAEWCRREKLPMVKTSEGDLTLKENSIGCIHITDELCNLQSGIPAIEFINNCYKALVPAGWLLVDVPSTDGRGAFCDPMHVSFWNELSFRYYTNQKFAKFVPKINCKFQQVVLKTYMPTKWHKDNNVPYVRSDMCALKGQTQAGICNF